LNPAWRERGSGVIVNLSSIQGRVGTPLEGPYAATKHAIEALSEALHVEVGHFGIRVVIVEPGYIAPGMKPGPSFDGPSVYDELRRQWAWND
jgi:NAD(P)-dependent dehydrogenase (short-subunit alcohol dehydrogenase family)